MNIQPNNLLLEFACAVCDQRRKEEYPDSIGCPFRCIDGEYCPYIEQAIEACKTGIDRFNEQTEYWKWATGEARQYAADLEKALAERSGS